jgi:hypothetical protein
MRTPDLAVRRPSAAALPKTSVKELPGGLSWDANGAGGSGRAAGRAAANAPPAERLNGRIADFTLNASGTRGEG